MVAQNFADVTFLSSISRTRWPFLKTDVPVVIRLMVPFVVPIDEILNEAMSHGDSFDHLVVNQELVEERQRHHVY